MIGNFKNYKWEHWQIASVSEASRFGSNATYKLCMYVLHTIQIICIATHVYTHIY